MMRKSTALKNIEKYKNETMYFCGEIKQKDMYNMLRNSMQFGEAETQVILSALVLAGAKFK